MTTFKEKYGPPLMGIGGGLVATVIVWLMFYSADIAEIQPNNYQEIKCLLEKNPDLRLDVVNAMLDGKISNWEFQKLIKINSRRSVQNLLLEKEIKSEILLK